MFGRGRVIGPQRHPGGAIAGDRRSVLDAVGRLELGIALEAEDTAASILPCAGQEVAELRVAGKEARRDMGHGPQPGAVEASLGKTRTEELAVMVDTFRPLKLTKAAAGLDDSRYPLSWTT